jgi:hypothetical protein
VNPEEEGVSAYALQRGTWHENQIGDAGKSNATLRLV